MSALETVGAITIGSVALTLVLVLLEIAINITCAALGALRLRRVLRAKTTWAAAPWIIRKALSGWHGPRYGGRYGEYYQVGGLAVPMDIRDPIQRRRL